MNEPEWHYTISSSKEISDTLSRGVGREKRREREGEEERKKEEREKRNQKRNEVEPVIPRTCGHRPLAAPRPTTASRPLTVMASAFRALRQPPLSQNPAYTPGMCATKP